MVRKGPLCKRFFVCVFRLLSVLVLVPVALWPCVSVCVSSCVTGKHFGNAHYAQWCLRGCHLDSNQPCHNQTERECRRRPVVARYRRCSRSFRMRSFWVSCGGPRSSYVSFWRLCGVGGAVAQREAPSHDLLEKLGRRFMELVGTTVQNGMRWTRRLTRLCRPS